MDIIPAPWTLKAIVTKLALELHEGTRQLSNIIKGHLDKSQDKSFTLVPLIDPRKGYIKITQAKVALNKRDWLKASQFDKTEHNWNSIITNELHFIEGFQNDQFIYEDFENWCHYNLSSVLFIHVLVCFYLLNISISCLMILIMYVHEILNFWYNLKYKGSWKFYIKSKRIQLIC